MRRNAMQKPLRIFFSSPSDVGPERRRGVLVIEKLAKEYARYFQITPILWESEPMLASGHFQDAIVPPSETDIVVLILWSRLGTPLPERTEHKQYRGIDGRVPVTGTEWEFEDALQAHKANGLPDLLAYRKTAKSRAEFGTEAEAVELGRQFKMLNVFWDRYFVNQGEFRAAYSQFEDIGSFEQRLDSDLRRLIERRIGALHSDAGKPFAANWLKGSPFRGLETYRFEHAQIFFGRSDATKTAVEHLVENAESGRPFLLILGASGAGKSSLAQAGVVPALGIRGVVRGVGEWRRAVMRPGQEPAGPFVSLAAALTAEEALPEMLKGHDAAALGRHLEASAADPTFPIKSAIAAREQAAYDQQQLARHERVKLVLVVDQLEELFTLGEVTPERRKAFVACLEGLVGSGCVFVIATMRSDYWHRAAELPRLIALAEGRGRFDLLHAGPAEITEMIRRPAETAGLSFEIDPRTEIRLDAALAEEAAREPGALPLLSFLLDALYSKDVEADRSSMLTYASMHALGGLKGAIATRAEAAITALPAHVQATMPKVLRALVTVSRSGADPTAREAPMARFAEGSAERQIIDALLGPQMRLLIAEGDGEGARVRVAHEALITHWERAKRQIAQDRDDLRTRAAVEEAEVAWRSASVPQKRVYLLHDPLLANAIDLLGRWSGELDSAMENFIRASRRRARLRHQLTAAAAVVFGLVAVVAIVAAEEALRAQRQADAERQLAQQTLTAATKTANSLIFDLAQRFRNAVGVPSEVVKDILQRAMALQGELAASGQGTPDVQFSAADALAENAQTLLVQGDSEGALAAAERANNILRGLLSQNPNNKQWRHDLSVSYERIGDAQLALGRHQEALDAYQASLNGRKQLAADIPDDPGVQRDLAISYLKVGDVMLVNNRLGDALAAYEQSLAFEQKAFDVGQSGQDWRHDLSISYERIGDVMTVLGKTDDALVAYRKSLDLRQNLASEDTGNAGWQRDLSISYERIGDVTAANGRRDDAIASLLNSQNNHDTLTHPVGVEEQKRTLAAIAGKSDDYPNADAEFGDAIAMYRKGLVIRRQLADSDKANAQWQRDLSISYMKLGDVLEAEQKHDDALTSYQMSFAVAERLPSGGERNVEWQRDRYVAQERIGDLLMEQGKFDDALAAFQNSLGLRQKLAATDFGNAQWQRDLFIIYDKIGDLELSQGWRDAAMASYQSSLDIRGRLAGEDVESAQRQNDLSIGYLKIGDALVAQGKRADALSSYIKSVAIARAATRENDGVSTRNLIFSLTRAASILIQSGQPAEAISYLDELSQLAPDDPSVYFDRGRAELYSDQIPAANDDLAKAITLKTNDPYFVIWLHIGRQRAHLNDSQELIGNADALNRAKWPWPIVALLIGTADPKAVDEIAQSGRSPRVRLERTCEADFYLGTYDLDRNANDDASKLFQSAAISCPRDFLEQSAARLELARSAGATRSSVSP
jgi:tetratricopeptide (TPR) repeat protein